MVRLSHAIAPKGRVVVVSPFQHNSSNPKCSGFLIILVATYSMAHHDIFREQLTIKYPTHGHALWEPSPGKLYSPVEVGDVGYVREGQFHRLFNALLAADHPSHRKFGVPEYHVPLVPNSSEHINISTSKTTHYCSYGISVEPKGDSVHASDAT